VVYTVDDDGNAHDVTTATAYADIEGKVEADFVSGSGLANIMPHMGVSSISLPIYAAIDVHTAELIYYQDYEGIGPQESLPAIQAAAE
jgi:hypothetical protein